MITEVIQSYGLLLPTADALTPPSVRIFMLSTLQAHSSTGAFPLPLRILKNGHKHLWSPGTSRLVRLFMVMLVLSLVWSGDAAATPDTLSVSPVTMPSATAGAAFAQQMSASGGTAPYTYGGAVPAGMNLTPGGLFYGTPTEGGSFNLVITVTDSTLLIGSRTYSSFTIVPATIALLPATLMTMNVGTGFNQTLTAYGGTAPYKFAFTGALPDGLSLGSDGVITGTPSRASTFNFTVMATDSSGGSGPYSGKRSYTVTVGPAAVPLAGNVNATVAYGSPANPITLNLSGGRQPR